MSTRRPPQAKAETARLGRQIMARGPPGHDGDFAVVAIGASAGGLEACSKLLNVLADGHGMAFILVQHLDPTHQSMMVDLLAKYTTMRVQQAADGDRLARDHLYIIPPGSYLSVENETLRLSRPEAPHGARLPFDFLLQSVAKAFGDRATCVILSGTGADGSVGLRVIKDHGGFVIAQNAEEAAFGGMPTSAIGTGLVDVVLPVAGIAHALVSQSRQKSAGMANIPATEPPAKGGPGEIVALLRKATSHDFTLYKQGTLQRRIERRMAMAGIALDDMARYLAVLRGNAGELDLLAKDLLINVTSFFRDPHVFDYLAKTIVPELIRSHVADQSLRIWIAGCSTGEETYSLAMLFHEAIAAAKASIKLQIFASDVDPDAVASAREGLYTTKIEAEISPARLARYFTRGEHGYKVTPELRGTVVFTVQDLLADPPFSRIDLVSCRNLLIYLLPEAQAKILSLFHFALRQDGILLLGSSETVGSFDTVFRTMAKSERVYRHVARSRPGEVDFTMNGAGTQGRVAQGVGGNPVLSREAARASLFQRTILETQAPASVMINDRNECLNSVGPTQHYLQVATGQFTNDLLAMVRTDLRAKLRSAIHQARRENLPVVIRSTQINPDEIGAAFSIAIQPVRDGDEQFLVISFVHEAKSASASDFAVPPEAVTRVAELERELDATRTELQGAIHNLEVSGEEQKAINEEALSVNEEYQSTNEELLTSKEELQALNEELTALNSQLQETLERSRTTSNDLQNILYSTDVATLFLDSNLKIRFFTPATRALFSVITGDIGRPLADLHSLSADSALLADARTMLTTLTPVEREIEAQDGAWYVRRILPYRTDDNGVEGVVITFTDITERKQAARAMEAAKQHAEQATLAKSRFLAAASHDLRQPLQTLKLVQGLLSKKAQSEATQKLVAMLDPTLSAMSGMLNTLLDMNQIDAGSITADLSDFPIGDLLDRLHSEFTYHADARALSLRVVTCGVSVHTDPRLLEQMLRNLLSNALKYTRHGKVLLGCRRHRDGLSIEIWDTGIGIPPEHLDKIFDEYHQIETGAREQSLGLGLSVVRRLADLLGHHIRVESCPDKGSLFAVEVPYAATDCRPRAMVHADGPATAHRVGAILVIDDDTELRETLALLLREEGHEVTTAADGAAALALVARGKFRPQLILSDFGLPHGLDGLQLTAKLRERLHRRIPSIILTGDISEQTSRHILSQDCVQLRKPLKPKILTATIEGLLPEPQPHIAPITAIADGTGLPIIYVVDDDRNIRDGLRRVLEENGRMVVDYATCEEFLEAYQPGHEACLLVDAYLPGMHGLELLRHLNDGGHRLPTIMITGSSDVPMALQAMKAGASDFIEKPIGDAELLASVERALEQARDSGKRSAWRQEASHHVAGLTERQRQIMDMVLAGHPSKNIAADLHISQRTVENHRASIMKKTGSKSLPGLARLALAAMTPATDR